MEDFRVDLRKAVAAKIGAKAKELMTVGRITVKEASIIAGTFQGETVIEKADNSDANETDIKTALKRKSWQNLGVAFGSKEARIAINKTKAFTLRTLKDLAELHPEKERATLKYAQGKLHAGGESDLDIEFLATAKLPGNANRVGQLIRLGLLSQINKLVTVEVWDKLPDYSGGGKDKKKEKEKGKENPNATETSTTSSTTTGTAKAPKGKVGAK